MFHPSSQCLPSREWIPSQGTTFFAQLPEVAQPHLQVLMLLLNLFNTYSLVLILKSHPWGLDLTPFKLILMFVFWPIMSHRCSLWHLEMVNHFKIVFSVPCSDPSDKSLYEMYLLNNWTWNLKLSFTPFISSLGFKSSLLIKDNWFYFHFFWAVGLSSIFENVH